MDEENIQAALDAQLLVYPDPPMALNNGAAPQIAPVDPVTNQLQRRGIDQILDPPQRQPPPDQQNRGVNNAHAQGALRQLINRGFIGFTIAAAQADLRNLCRYLYRQFRWWCYWAYFVCLGLFGEPCLRPYHHSTCFPSSSYHEIQKVKSNTDHQDEHGPMSTS